MADITNSPSAADISGASQHVEDISGASQHVEDISGASQQILVTVPIKYAYLAGSIVHDDSVAPEVRLWRDKASAFLASNQIWALSPTRGRPAGLSREAIAMLSPNSIVDRDLSDIRRSSVLIVEMTLPSYPYIGSFMEMAYAKQAGIPIIVWSTLQTITSHPWVKYHAAHIVSTIEEALAESLNLLRDA